MIDLIKILGSNGFIGSNLLKYFHGNGVTRDNYDFVDKHCDVLINAAGNSSKLLPERDPLTDFDRSVRDVLKSVVDFSFDTYVYISSCEVYTYSTDADCVIDVSNISRYGLSKYLAECIVKKYCKNWLILRLNGPVGNNMKKGPVFDILKGDHLWLSDESQFQFIHTDEIARFINFCLKNNITNQIFNLTGKGSIELKEVMRILGRTVNSVSDEVVIHNVDVDKTDKLFKLPTSLNSIERLKESYEA